MKLAIISFLFVMAFSAQAMETTLLTKTYSKNDTWELFRTSYRVNPDMGRAWFELELADMSGISDDLYYEDHRAMPEGMYFDTTTGEIKIHDVVCATTKRGRKSLKIYPTGNCIVRSNESRVQVDDGFEIKTKNQLKITLETL